ncbi:MAG: tetratricopeptide repeat protein, partial [Bacteroidetes bacterium]|nr:tetratricopeptide repeat protein [Bacteroidota bacterium]
MNLRNLSHYLLPSVFTLAAVSINAQSVQQAAIYTRNEQYEDASRMLQSLKSKKPTDPVLAYQQAWNSLKSDDVESAMKSFQEAYTLNPKSPEGLIGAGIKALWEGKNTDAENLFNQGLAVAKKKASAMRNNIGEAYMFAPKGDLGKAIEYLKAATETDNLNAEGYVLLGDALWAKNPIDASPAIQNYITAEDLAGPNKVVAITKQGKVWTRARVFDRARQDFDRAIAMDPNYAPVYREIGDYFYARGKIDSALSFYQEYLRRNNNPSARRKYVSALYLAKQYDQAISEGESLLQVMEYPNIYGLLAYSIAERSNSIAADAAKGLMYLDRYNTKSLDRKQTAMDVYTKSNLLAMSGDSAESLKVREEAIRMEGAKDVWFDDMASGYYKRKRYADAARIYALKSEMAKKLTLNDLIYQGMSNYYIKDYRMADSIMAKVITLSPDYNYGRLIRAKSNLQLDTFQESWSAKPFFEEWMKNL